MLNGKKIIYCAGTWDLFHIGHLNMIRQAKEIADSYGGRLVVGVTTDEHTADYKGCKPFVPYQERFDIIRALKYPDVVVKQTRQFHIFDMEAMNIDIVVLGSDWKESMPSHLVKMMEAVEVIFLDRTAGVSTSQIKHDLKLERE